MRVDDVVPPPAEIAARDVASRALERAGGVEGIAAAAAPTLAFVAANALGGLSWAFIALAVTAPVVFGVRLARREPVRAAVVGLAVAAVCAVVAAVAGEARAFFLLPTLLPAVLMLVFVGSVLVRRPVTGILLNRMVGGPQDWARHPGLLRVYAATTLVGAVIHAVNLAVRVVFYLDDQVAALAVVQIVTGPVFAVLAAVTLLAARRAVQPPASIGTAAA